MLRRFGIFALPLGVLCALALGACGSSNSQKSGETVPPLAATHASTAARTVTTTTATTPTTTAPNATTTTSRTPSTTPTATQPTTGFAGGARGATTTQPTGGAPAGCPPAVGGFIRDLRGTDCGVARQVATAWFSAVHGGAAPDSPIEAAGYSCSGTLSGERANVTCSGASGGVAFTASP